MKYNKLIYIALFIILLSSGCAKKDETETVSQPDVEAPSAPSSLAAQETSGMINLSWSRSQESDVVKYRLYRSSSAISNSPKLYSSPVQKASFAKQGYIEETGTFYADSDITMGSTYYYRLSALDRNNNESNKSNQVMIIYGDHVAPSKPTGLTASTGAQKGEINLKWNANSESDLLSYKIYKSDSGINFSLLSTRSKSETTYTVSGLVPGSGYFFKITALDNSSNESEYSSIVYDKAKGDNTAPKMPAGLTALAGAAGTGRVNLSWTANTESDLAKYNIYQSASGSGYIKIDEKKKPETTYVYYGLSSTYCYFRIKAVDDSDNESEYSGQVGVTVP